MLSVSHITSEGRFGVVSSTERELMRGSGRETDLLFATLMNFDLREPLTTAVRRWQFAEKGKGKWSPSITAKCRTCWNDFKPGKQALERIRGMNSDIKPDDAPALSLPAEAWQDELLMVKCSSCGRSHHLNPYAVDLRISEASRPAARVVKHPFKLETDTAETKILGSHASQVTAVAVSIDSLIAASASLNGEIRIWNLEEKGLVGKLAGRGKVETLAFREDGKSLVSGLRNEKDTEVNIWDFRKGELLRRLSYPLHSDAINLIGGGRWALIAREDEICWWQLHENKIFPHRIKIGKADVLTASFRGGLIAVGSRDNFLHLVQYAAWTHWLKLKCQNRIRSAAVSSDGLRAFYATEDRTVRVWDVEQNKELTVLTGHEAPVIALALSPDNRRLVSASEDGRSILWDLDRSEIVQAWNLKAAGASCRFTPDNKAVIFGDQQGDVSVLICPANKDFGSRL